VLFALVLIIGLGVALRLIWATFVSVEPVSDSFAYFSFATNIAAGNGYSWASGSPTTYWAVGPSAYYAFFHLFLEDGMAVVVANLIAAIAGLFSIFFVGFRYYGSHAGLLAAFLFAIWPTSIMFTTVYNSEMLFAPLVLAALWVAGKANLGLGGWAVIGTIFALAALVRPVAILFPLVYGLSIMARSGQFTRVLAGVAFACLVMAVCIAPWTLRNYQVTNEFILISTNGGTNLWMGNNPSSDGTYQKLPDRVRGLSEFERNKLLGSEAKKYILDQPGAFVQRTSVKFLKLHRSETIGVAWNEKGMKSGPFGSLGILLKGTGSLFWWTTIVGAVAGLVIMVCKHGLWRSMFHPIIISACYLIAVQSVVVSQDRYHLQWSPHYILLTAYSLSCLLMVGATARGFERGQSGPTPALGG
jgi:4-amino-4-deoxy-L-arabinose transferase-like glycosyltransferase